MNFSIINWLHKYNSVNDFCVFAEIFETVCNIYLAPYYVNICIIE
jgi:hypothetical protein